MSQDHKRSKASSSVRPPARSPAPSPSPSPAPDARLTPRSPAPSPVRPPASPPVPDDALDRLRRENEELRAANRQFEEAKVQQQKNLNKPKQNTIEQTNEHGGRQTKLKQQNNKTKHTKTTKKVAEDCKSHEAQ